MVVGLEKLDLPTKWPNANARLLGAGAGLPVMPLDRLAQFSADQFERFTLEWAHGYLAKKLEGVYEVQQRGGSGDKGRDIVVWFNPPASPSRRSHIYQCKRYASALGVGIAAGEIAKVLFYSHKGDYTLPEEYWFVTHKGVNSDLQDLIDEILELASRLCNFRTRGAWAVSRLLMLACSVLRKSGVDPTDPHGVRQALEQITKTD